MKQAKITFHGGVGLVTGSNFLFETLSEEKNVKILIDCGLIQGNHKIEQQNRKPFGYDPASIDVLFVTHAHIDHIGRIPKLVKDGFRGKIYSTPPTRALAGLMLDDALSVMNFEARKGQGEPLYESEHVAKALNLWEELDYYKVHKLSDSLRVTFKEAGHILGSAMVEIRYGQEAITFTGDLGNSPSPLLRDTDSVKDSKYLVMESVYGDRLHEDREGRTSKLKSIIENGVKKGGPIIFPAFSLERTQVLLYELNNMIESGELPPVPVFLDSPLAIKVTEVYKKYRAFFNEQAKADLAKDKDIFSFPNFHMSLTKDDSREINETHGPKIIIAGSGMSHGGRVLFHEKNYLSDPRSTVVIVGYQVPGSIGRLLMQGDKQVRVLGKQVAVKAKIELLMSYSAHKDRDGLFEFAERALENGTKKIFVVLGEPKSGLFLTQRLRDFLEADAYYPAVDESVVLDF